ncbi:sensor histidine kinase [Pseudomonas botevensis]|uniref:sensor histidine kinase n=1 Tax=Pseudomonas botevensis TaxID=2842352 RepID=UPI001C3E7C60|nr:sensor histidine kinase [Pseudomonas botevensis]MBV4477589.1 sensor histidine kinase [Pseudomonas botevensis]
MSTPPHDPGSALAIRSHYRQSQSRAARLRLLVDTGQELTQLRPSAMRQRALQRACAFMAMDQGVLLEWSATQAPRATAEHGNSERLAALYGLARVSTLHPEWLPQTDASLPQVLSIPLPGADGQPFGVLLLTNSVALTGPDREDMESLQLLATLLAAHLENHRLLEALQARERTMSELVHRLFTAQEDERKRVAYDLHDGLAQTQAGLHQRLQGFAGRCPTLPQPLQSELQAILNLAQACVGEGRQLIGGLRPGVLDDFGLFKAIDKEADRLRDAGIEVFWQQQSSARLPGACEIALFRIAQEGINNMLKHAHASRALLSLQLTDGQASLSLQDNGRGFAPDTPLPGGDNHHLGLAAMQERASLLGGELSWHNVPEGGTRLHARVPLPTAEETR